MSKLKTDHGLEIAPGDSVVIIGQNGNIKKLVVPEINSSTEHTLGTERLLEILKMFDPTVRIETLENIDKEKLN